MPKITSSEDLDQIAAAIAKFPNGADVGELAAALGSEISNRTLQRRLSELVARKRVLRERTWRTVKYKLAPITGTPPVTLNEFRATIAGEVYVRTSSEGEEIKTYVRRPIQERRPVGYNVEFLETYTPNQSWYLPENLRDQLQAMGMSQTGEAAAGTFARDILNRLLIDLSWASSRLEGNTYSRLDTEQLIQFGQAAEGKDALETQMILNHKNAIEYLVHDAQRIAINNETVIALHALLSDGLMDNPMDCGRLRHRPVEISGSVYLPIALPQRLDELFRIVLEIGSEICDPFEQAFFLMVHLPYLQPFRDVNKRVSRLAANIPLIKRNLSPLSFIDVPEQAYVDAVLGVYELNRIELLRDVFVWAYERSCQQYVAVRNQLVPPDTFRLRHRNALADTIRSIILAGLPPSESAVLQHLPPSVSIDDRNRFVDLVIEEFKTLHAGNVVRFGVRPLEFETWKSGPQSN